MPVIEAQRASILVPHDHGQIDDQTAQLRTLKALLGDHIADAVEHTVRCEQIPKPLGVQGITLAIVVRLQNDREVSLLTLGQVPVGERQPDGRTGASGRVAADAWPVSVPPASAATAGTAARAAPRARNERRFVEDMVIPFDGQAAYVGWASQGCSVQQGHEDLLQARRGEVQHLSSAGCLQQRPQDHRRTGERPLPDSGDSRTPRAALPISLAAIARHPEDHVAGELYPARRTSRARRGLIGRHDRVATLDCAVGKRTTIISAPAGSGKTSLMHAGPTGRARTRITITRIR